MKDNDNMVQCDLCLMMNPLSHMSDDWFSANVCVPCAKTVAKDLDKIT